MKYGKHRFYIWLIGCAFSADFDKTIHKYKHTLSSFSDLAYFKLPHYMASIHQPKMYGDNIYQPVRRYASFQCTKRHGGATSTRLNGGEIYHFVRWHAIHPSSSVYCSVQGLITPSCMVATHELHKHVPKIPFCKAARYGGMSYFQYTPLYGCTLHPSVRRRYIPLWNGAIHNTLYRSTTYKYYVNLAWFRSF
jgi:hypothetical protein